jgi:uncharacterized protein (DUF58 family)
VTTRGRTIAFLAVSMLVFGRLSGLRELVMVGAAFGLVLGAGFVLVWARGGNVRVKRSVMPTCTTVGRSVRVELAVEAAGRFGIGPLLLADKLPPDVGPSPRLSLPGGQMFGAGRRQRAVAYTVSPRLRGRHPIGPLEVTHTDPFGAIRRRQDVAGTSPLVVYPSYEDVSVLPSAVQRLGIVRHSPNIGQGDEFYALRSYVEGDDLRKIHWPTSLKTGDLVIRQEELLAEPRALLVLDTAAAKHRGAGAESSLEAAVSACASIGVLALHRRMRLEVVTNEGPLLRTRNPSQDEFLEALAMLKPSRGGIARALDRAERTRGRPALVVVITPDLRRDEVRSIALRARNSPAGAIVWIDASSFETRGTTGAKRQRAPAPVRSALPFPLIALRAGQSFRHAWHTNIKDVALAR